MNKLNLVLVIFLLGLVLACAQFKTAVNNISEPTAKQTMPVTNLYRNAENAEPDKHIGDENAIVVSVLPGDQYYFGIYQYRLDALEEKLNQSLEKNPSERQLAYLNADAFSDYGDIVEALHTMRKQKIENVALRVVPKNENAKGYYVLRVKLPPEPSFEDDLSKPKPYMLVVTQEKNNKLKLTGDENNPLPANERSKLGKSEQMKFSGALMEREQLKNTLTEIFKERESRGVFREGTNEVETSVYIKVRRSDQYLYALNLVDLAKGAGATTVYLQLDDLNE
jgi:biopolymer transport protein ExbD